jgi:hypothetical protein
VFSFLHIENDDDDYDTVTTTAVPPVTLAPEIRVAEEKLRYLIPILHHTSGYSITYHQVCTVEGTSFSIVVFL